jgi:hypothetical protein
MTGKANSSLPTHLKLTGKRIQSTIRVTKAALRFENSRRDGNILYSKVSNCVFHHNGGFAISVVLSKNVKV